NGMNPFGGVCGAVCPDKFCVKACVHRTFDSPVRIPEVQAKIVQKAFELGAVPVFKKAQKRKEKVAIIGGGPAGFSAAATLAQLGYGVVVFESEKKPGGMCGLIPGFRMAENFLKNDISFIKTLGDITIKHGTKIADPASLPEKGFDASLVCAGLEQSLKLNIKGEESAVYWNDFLKSPDKFKVKGKIVAVIGGGAVAADCAEIAARSGAAHVEMFALENLSEMPLESRELRGLMDAGIHLSGRTRVVSIQNRGNRITGIKTIKVALPEKKPFHPKNVNDIAGSEQARRDIGFVVIAIGARGADYKQRRGVFLAGDLTNGASTVVEAAASGKNAAMEIAAFLNGKKYEKSDRQIKSTVCLNGYNPLPICLDTEFFGRKINSPFLLSAAPPTDGYDQMKKAYEAGWAGGVMKTAFDGIPIHIPSEYMFAFTKSTYGNCDNVSGHALDRVCGEIGRLRREFPDRLTMASTGGPVTGRDEEDKAIWLANTKKLEDAGAMGIEYSLSCPQGGDGTKGDIVSQDVELTAKIVDWVMEASDPGVPKLFKLTAAVTAISPIITAIRAIFEKYPEKKAGVTLANTFPAMAFRKGKKKTWEEGIIVGMK
ncbi:MAG: FAD-dependent oxidoreductase, partial [Deltaproteobacteria bacterium]|nr:FAD-dependent oxidoreductase [Deltaproteobacteria bacterium]